MVEKNDIPPQGRATYPRPVEYDHDAKGNIVIPAGAPFDGNPVLIKIGAGWVEARWEDHDKMTDSGFGWVVLDDALGFTELDDAQEWAPLPGAPAEGEPDKLVERLREAWGNSPKEAGLLNEAAMTISGLRSQLRICQSSFADLQSRSPAAIDDEDSYERGFRAGYECAGCQPQPEGDK